MKVRDRLWIRSAILAGVLAWGLPNGRPAWAYSEALEGQGAREATLAPPRGDLMPALVQPLLTPDAVTVNADEALDTGSAEALVNLLTNDVARGIRIRVARVSAMQRRAHESRAARRAYVEAYQELIRYAQRLSRAAAGEPEPRP